MPANVPPSDSEQELLGSYLAQQLDAFRSLAYGLRDDQARSTPTPSALSVGGLVKHATGVSRSWLARVAAAPEAPEPDPRPREEQYAAWADEHVMRPDETLAGLIDGLDALAAEAERVLADADLEARVPVPRDAPWFPDDLDTWSVRWVVLHLIEELARHAGHGDIIREAIDGATMYELVAGREGWPATDWLTPWQPPADAAATGGPAT